MTCCVEDSASSHPSSSKYSTTGKPNDPDEFAVGAELLGYKGYADYEGCVVEEVTETGYKVLFTEYGDREELPRERLRSRVDLERFRVSTKTKEILLEHSSIRSIATYENLI